jgi:hypothetical protein
MHSCRVAKSIEIYNCWLSVSSFIFHDRKPSRSVTLRDVQNRRTTDSHFGRLFHEQEVNIRPGPPFTLPIHGTALCSNDQAKPHH